MIQRLKEKGKNKKGFTLVELIVVLVILAILIAMLVPSLTGYIDKAKDKQVQAEAKLAMTAAQTIAGEKYAEGTTVAEIEKLFSDDEYKKLAELKTGASVAITLEADAKLKSFEYTSASGKVVKYNFTTNKFE